MVIPEHRMETIETSEMEKWTLEDIDADIKELLSRKQTPSERTYLLKLACVRHKITQLLHEK